MTGIFSIPIIVAIIVVAETRKLISQFKNTGAINETNAKTLEELKINRRLIFSKFLFHNVIIEVDNKYYLNEQNLKDYRVNKRIILIAIVLLIIIVFVLLDIAIS